MSESILVFKNYRIDIYPFLKKGITGNAESFSFRFQIPSHFALMWLLEYFFFEIYCVLAFPRNFNLTVLENFYLYSK